jgi:hypothetical protein
MIKAEPDRSFEIMGKRVNQSAEAFKASAGFIEWLDAAKNRDYVAKGLPQFQQKAHLVQRETGVVRRSRSHPPSDLVASDWAGFPRWGGELGACLTERTGFYDPYAALAYPGVDRVRTSRPFGFAAAGA